MSRLTAQLRHFVRDESGVVLAEFLILLPMMIWALLAIFVYWDAYRAIGVAQKASYAVSDVISRQDDVPRAFLNGMDDVMAMMVDKAVPGDIRMRITSVEWDRTRNRFDVLFSHSPGNRLPALTAAQINNLSGDYRPRIPTIADHDSVVILETEIDHTPIFRVGVPAKAVKNLVITRPRYRRRICLVESMATCPATL